MAADGLPARSPADPALLEGENGELALLLGVSAEQGFPAREIDRLCERAVIRRLISAGLARKGTGGNSRPQLTEEGHRLVRWVLAEGVRAIGQAPAEVLKPVFNPVERTLTWDTVVVKRWTRMAPSQWAALKRFEKDGWPPSIPNPLPEHAGMVAAERLNDLKKCLNRGLKTGTIWFSLDEGRLCWHTVDSEK